jgi:hypothetical protein
LNCPFCVFLMRKKLTQRNFLTAEIYLDNLKTSIDKVCGGKVMMFGQLPNQLFILCSLNKALKFEERRRKTVGTPIKTLRARLLSTLKFFQPAMKRKVKGKTLNFSIQRYSLFLNLQMFSKKKSQFFLVNRLFF